MKASEVNEMIHQLTAANLIQYLMTPDRVTAPLLQAAMRFLLENKVTGKMPGSMKEAQDILDKYQTNAPYKITEAS